MGVVAVKNLGGGAYEFCKLVVQERARGLGVGRALVEACISFVRNAGGRLLMLQSFRRLEVALGMYERMGFVPMAPPPQMLVLSSHRDRDGFAARGSRQGLTMERDEIAPRVPLHAQDIESFVRDFEACTLPKPRWTHQAHLLVGLWYLSQAPACRGTGHRSRAHSRLQCCRGYRQYRQRRVPRNHNAFLPQWHRRAHGATLARSHCPSRWHFCSSRRSHAATGRCNSIHASGCFRCRRAANGWSRICRVRRCFLAADHRNELSGESRSDMRMTTPIPAPSRAEVARLSRGHIAPTGERAAAAKHEGT